MKTQIITKEKTDLNLVDETASFTIRLGAVVCGLIGIWSVACLISALVSVGPAGMIRGYITAITGM